MKVLLLSVVNTNLFPFTIKPINITSPQQADLIHQSIADQVPLALGFHMSEELESRSIVGYGMPYVADKRKDGSILIYIQGIGKVNIENRKTVSNGVSTYSEVEEIIEILELDDKYRKKYVALSKYFANWIDKYIPDENQKDFFIKSLTGAKEVVSACAVYLVKDFEIQYELMEIFNINDQIEYLYRLMLSKQLIF